MITGERGSSIWRHYIAASALFYIQHASHLFARGKFRFFREHKELGVTHHTYLSLLLQVSFYRVCAAWVLAA